MAVGFHSGYNMRISVSLGFELRKFFKKIMNLLKNTNSGQPKWLEIWISWDGLEKEKGGGKGRRRTKHLGNKMGRVFISKGNNLICKPKINTFPNNFIQLKVWGVLLGIFCLLCWGVLFRFCLFWFSSVWFHFLNLIWIFFPSLIHKQSSQFSTALQSLCYCCFN